MKGGVKVTGLQSVQMLLRSIGELVPDTARGQMKRSADRIVKRAKLFVPEDSEELKKSIRKEIDYEGRGRLKITVIAGDKTVMIDGRQVDLDQYAAIIHERYSDMTPGEKTQAKQNANPGVLVGERYLDRASEEEEAGLERNLIAATTSLIKGLSK